MHTYRLQTTERIVRSSHSLCRTSLRVRRITSSLLLRHSLLYRYWTKGRRAQTMSSSHNQQAHEVQCYTCGGPLLFEIEICPRCHCKQHMHCMPLYPRKIVDNWVCEGCRDGTYIPRYRAMFCMDLAGRKQSKKHKAIPTGKVKFLSYEEVKLLSSGAPSKTIRANKERICATGHEKQKKYRSIDVVYAAEKAKMTCSSARLCATVSEIDETDHQSPLEDVIISAPECPNLKTPRMLYESGQLSPRDEVTICDAIPANIKTSDMPGNSFHAVEESKGVSVSSEKESDDMVNYSVPRQYLPALHDVWSGSFKFIDTGISAESFYFKAHPPSDVHHKAYELSRRMPELLHVTFIPQYHLRSDLFQLGHPQVDDLALYFFPQDKANSYKNICELMELQKSVIITSIEGVELLIFSPKQLEIEPWDVCGGEFANFLGGVFHRSKKPQLLQMTHQEMSVDMDNGIIGGESVGASDLVISRVPTSNLSGRSGTVTKQDVKKARVLDEACDQEQCGNSVMSLGINIEPEVPSKGSKRDEPAQTKVQEWEDDRLHPQGFTSPVAASSNLSRAVKVKSEEMEKLLRWQAPPQNWVKLNIAASLGKESPSTAAAGGVVRDDAGRWVFGYRLTVNNTGKTLEPELSALVEGAKLLWDRGYKKVIAEFSLLPVTKSLAGTPPASDPNKDLIQICREIITQRLDCKVHNVERSQNLCAELLANHSKSEGGRLQVFEIPPLELVTLLHGDCSSSGN